jgi:anti-anti-sigma factor
MQLNFSSSKGFTIVGITGRIDTVTAGEFETKISEHTSGQGKKIVIDCSGLDYISSSGLRVFLTSQKKTLANGGVLKLCCLQPSIREIFDITGFSNILEIDEDLSAAMGS